MGSKPSKPKRVMYQVPNTIGETDAIKRSGVSFYAYFIKLRIRNHLLFVDIADERHFQHCLETMFAWFIQCRDAQQVIDAFPPSNSLDGIQEAVNKYTADRTSRYMSTPIDTASIRTAMDLDLRSLNEVKPLSAAVIKPLMADYHKLLASLGIIILK